MHLAPIIARLQWPLILRSRLDDNTTISNIGKPSYPTTYNFYISSTIDSKQTNRNPF